MGQIIFMVLLGFPPKCATFGTPKQALQQNTATKKSEIKRPALPRVSTELSKEIEQRVWEIELLKRNG